MANYRVGIIVSMVDEVSIAAKKISASLNNLDSHAENFRNSFGNSFQDLGWAMAGATISAAALYKTMDSLINLSAPFEHSMAKVNTMFDGNSVDISKLSSDILEIASAYGQSISLATAAEYQALSSGLVDAGTSALFMDKASRLAIGGNTDLKTSIDALTNAMGAYNLKAAQLTEISDAMFLAAKLGKTEVDELARHMGRVTPIAAQMGVSPDELMSAISVLTTSGLSTPHSVTRLNALLTSITKAERNKAARDEASRLGIKWDAQTFREKGMVKFLQDAVNSPNFNAGSFEKLINTSEGLVGIQALLVDGGQRWQNQLDAMKNKAGETSEAYSKMAGTFVQQSAVFNTTLQSILIQGFNPILEVLNKMLQVINPLILMINKLMSFKPIAFIVTLSILAVLGAMLGAFIISVFIIIDKVNHIYKILKQINSELQKMNDGFSNLPDTKLDEILLNPVKNTVKEFERLLKMKKELKKMFDIIHDNKLSLKDIANLLAGYDAFNLKHDIFSKKMADILGKPEIGLDGLKGKNINKLLGAEFFKNGSINLAELYVLAKAIGLSKDQFDLFIKSFFKLSNATTQVNKLSAAIKGLTFSSAINGIRIFIAEIITSLTTALTGVASALGLSLTALLGIFAVVVVIFTVIMSSIYAVSKAWKDAWNLDLFGMRTAIKDLLRPLLDIQRYLKQAWDTFKDGKFLIDRDLYDRLQKSGFGDLAKSLSAAMLSVKAFGEGVMDVIVPIYKAFVATIAYITKISATIMQSFNRLIGFIFGKNFIGTDVWRNLGRVLGVILGLLMSIVFVIGTLLYIALQPIMWMIDMMIQGFTIVWSIFVSIGQTILFAFMPLITAIDTISKLTKEPLKTFKLDNSPPPNIASPSGWNSQRNNAETEDEAKRRLRIQTDSGNTDILKSIYDEIVKSNNNQQNTPMDFGRFFEELANAIRRGAFGGA